MAQLSPQPILPLPVLPAEIPPDPALASVLAHWNLVRGDQLVPRRGDLTMRGLLPCLPTVTIFELCEDDILIRMAGTAMRVYYGVDATGRSLKDFTAPEIWPIRFRRFKAGITHPCGIWYTLDGNVALGETDRVGKLSLPISEVGPEKRLGFLNISVNIPAKWGLGDNPQEPAKYGMARQLVPIDVGAGVADLG